MRKRLVSGQRQDEQFLVKCRGLENPREGWGPSVLSCKGNCGFFLSFSLFFSFRLWERETCLNRAFVALYYRESQKMFYVNDYAP